MNVLFNRLWILTTIFISINNGVYFFFPLYCVFCFHLILATAGPIVQTLKCAGSFLGSILVGKSATRNEESFGPREKVNHDTCSAEFLDNPTENFWNWDDTPDLSQEGAHTPRSLYSVLTMAQGCSWRGLWIWVKWVYKWLELEAIHLHHTEGQFV